MTSLATFEAHAGKGASIVHYGQFWKSGGAMQPFYPGDHQRIRDHGAIPLLDWNPWDAGAGGSPSQPDFALGRIIAGDYDAYITEWATGARNWGHPFFLRFAHEMNGDWYPWSENEERELGGAVCRRLATRPRHLRQGGRHQRDLGVEPQHHVSRQHRAERPLPRRRLR